MKSLIKLVSIGELQEKSFIIPSYQRGYKWTKKQVEDLLNDLNDFRICYDNKESSDSFYCLQPLVVKRMSMELPASVSIQTDDTEEAVHKRVEEAFNKNVKWEVIDGQQRLTSVFILLHYLDEKNFFSLAYTTKSASDGETDYISSLLIDPEAKKNDNVDFFHMSGAYSTIKKWFKDIDKADKERIKSIILDHTQFIWYETNEPSIKVFTRLNIGKIGLTNSELIKALIMSHYNNDVLKQHSIATEWNDMEQTLQDDELWYFIHEAEYDKPTRIDFLFDILCDLRISEMSQNERAAHKERIGTDKYRTFRHYELLFKQSKDEYESQWKKLKELFATILEWHRDNGFYHYIGYILCDSKQVHIDGLYKEWKRKDNKGAYLGYLKDQVKIIINKCNRQGIADLLEQQYEIPIVETRDTIIPKTECRPILLLHNIQTVINQNKQIKSEDPFARLVFYRFPFYRYKKEKWDVEHIDSNATNNLKDNFSRLIYLLQYRDVLASDRYYRALLMSIISHITNNELGDSIDQDRIKEKIKDCPFKTTVDGIEVTLEKVAGIIDGRRDSKELDEKRKNQIGNFTLLDSSTNRGYGNSIFPAKRLTIMAKDMGKAYCLSLQKKNGPWEFYDELKAQSTSSFIPPVTRNVFMKYYSPKTQDFAKWEIDDYNAYKGDIKSVLEDFLS